MQTNRLENLFFASSGLKNLLQVPEGYKAIPLVTSDAHKKDTFKILQITWDYLKGSFTRHGNGAVAVDGNMAIKMGYIATYETIFM